MATRSRPAGQQGFTVISLLITVFVLGTVVTGLFGLFLLAMRSSQESERRIVAIALANERLEQIRNLPYVDVGTSGGWPPGDILQSEDITRNNAIYTVTTDIRYVDDPYDGIASGGSLEEGFVTLCHYPPGGGAGGITITVGASSQDAHVAHGDTVGACGEEGSETPPTDAYNADYKQVRVEATWNSVYDPSPVLLLTYVAPNGIEGNDEGGTLDFQALDAAGSGVSEASVSIVNDETDPQITINTQTNSEGRVVIPALPESSDSYEIAVSKEGYTSEQTYDVDPTFIPDTDHSHVSIIVQEITSKTFFIDLVGSLTVETQDDTSGALPDIPFHIQGQKTIGVDDDGDAVYVMNEDASTDAVGTVDFADVVWDTYDLTIDGVATGYDIKESSELLPLVMEPGDDTTVTLTLVPHTDYSLHVTVVDADNNPIDNATVHAVGGASYDETLGTGVVGQVFFEDMPSQGTYDLDVSAPGFEVDMQQTDVQGSERIYVTLTPSP